MNHLFDTSILIDIRRGNKTTLDALNTLSINADLPPCITTLTYGEFYFGTLTDPPSEHQKGIEFLAKFPLVTLTRSSAKIWAELRKKHLSLGKPLSAIDLFIASIAIEQGRCLITKDKDFSAIDNLHRIIIK